MMNDETEAQEALNNLTKFTKLLNGKAETTLWGEGHSCLPLHPKQDLHQRNDQLTSCAGDVIKRKYDDIPDIRPFLGASRQ